MAQTEIEAVKFIEDMTADEQIAEIHGILESATNGIAQAGDNAMLRAMRFPTIVTARQHDDDLADSLAKLRQLAKALETIGNNPMLAGLGKSFIGG